MLTPTPFDSVKISAKTRTSEAADFSYLSPFRDYDSVLTRYSEWEKSLAPSDVTAVIDLHSSVLRWANKEGQDQKKYPFTKDGIHPTTPVHLAMALEILSSLGISLPVDDLDQEVQRLEGDSLFTLTKARREQRSAGWLAYVGYTRDKSVKTDSIDETEKAAAKAALEIAKTSAD